MIAKLDINLRSRTGENGRSHGHKSPERRCIASGKSKPREEMLRLVLSPNGTVVADVYSKLPGRGVWITPKKSAIEKALKTGAFARGFKRKVNVPDTLGEQITTSLRERVLGMIGMAKRAGQLECGFDNVRTCARAGEIAVRIEASDGREDGRAKIRVITKAIAKEFEEPMPLLIGCFDSKSLGKALGRNNLVHAGIRRGALAKSITKEAERLAGFVPLLPPDWPDITHEAQDETHMQKKLGF